MKKMIPNDYISEYDDNKKTNKVYVGIKFEA